MTPKQAVPLFATMLVTLGFGAYLYFAYGHPDIFVFGMLLTVFCAIPMVAALGCDKRTKEKKEQAKGRYETAVGRRVMIRGNDNEGFEVGKIAGYELVSKAQNPLPVIVKENGEKVLCAALLVPYEEGNEAARRFRDFLETLAPEEQWNFLADLKWGFVHIERLGREKR